MFSLKIILATLIILANKENHKQHIQIINKHINCLSRNLLVKFSMSAPRYQSLDCKKKVIRLLQISA